MADGDPGPSRLRSTKRVSADIASQQISRWIEDDGEVSALTSDSDSSESSFADYESRSSSDEEEAVDLQIQATPGPTSIPNRAIISTSKRGRPRGVAKKGSRSTTASRSSNPQVQWRTENACV